jgi:hypothetical protein
MKKSHRAASSSCTFAPPTTWTWRASAIAGPMVAGCNSILLQYSYRKSGVAEVSNRPENAEESVLLSRVVGVFL